MINQGELVAQGSPTDVFSQEELLTRVQLGIPTALEIIKQFQGGRTPDS